MEDKILKCILLLAAFVIVFFIGAHVAIATMDIQTDGDGDSAIITMFDKTYLVDINK
jgi:hypothetical protein